MPTFVGLPTTASRFTSQADAVQAQCTGGHAPSGSLASAEQPQSALECA